MGHEHCSKITCPKCQSTGGLFRLVYPIFAFCEVLGFEDGKLVAGDQHNGGEGYDDEQSPDLRMLECQNSPGGKFCGHRWPAPAWLTVTWDPKDRKRFLAVETERRETLGYSYP